MVGVCGTLSGGRASSRAGNICQELQIYLNGSMNNTRKNHGSRGRDPSRSETSGVSGGLTPSFSY